MFDYATTDLVLAIAHHLLIFALAGVIAYELATMRAGIAGAAALRVARIDAWYGILAGAIIIVGLARAKFAAKGWDYYQANPYFWAKMGSFAAVGLLSIAPTVAFLKWKRALKTNPAFAPSETDIARVRKFLWLEVAFFAFIPVFAAMMARMT